MTPIRQEGEAARRRGESFGRNPYPLGTLQSRQWSAGWRCADEDPNAVAMERGR